MTPRLSSLKLSDLMAVIMTVEMYGYFFSFLYLYGLAYAVMIDNIISDIESEGEGLRLAFHCHHCVERLHAVFGSIGIDADLGFEIEYRDLYFQDSCSVGQLLAAVHR